MSMDDTLPDALFRYITTPACDPTQIPKLLLRLLELLDDHFLADYRKQCLKRQAPALSASQQN